MPSRAILTPLSKNKSVTVDDVNAIYHILNGSYTNSNRVGGVMGTTTRGLGMPVRLTGFDGRMSTGLIDTTSYALDVRNREATQQRSFAARRADNQIVLDVLGGKAYAQFNGGASVSTQILVNGSTAGGVLGGTYPDPTFYLAPEQYVLRPKMIVQWFGSNATVLVAGNLELQDAPGWVLCGGQSVTMRDASVVVVPNMQDRYPIGAGGTYALGATAGNTLAGQQSISIAHGHSIAHTHSHDHAHEHTVPNHAHSHTHGMNSHTHGLATHTHTAGSHTHDLSNHTHGPNTLSLPHRHSHNHGPSTLSLGHRHQHNHGGTPLGVFGNTGSPNEAGNSVDNPDGGGTTTAPADNHTHGAGGLDVSGSTDSDDHDLTSTTSSSGTTTTEDTSISSTQTASGTTDVPSNNGTSSATPTINASGALTTDAATGTTASDATSNGTTTTTNKQSSVDASVASTTTTSSQTTTTAINGQPPTLALWFIMKL